MLLACGVCRKRPTPEKSSRHGGIARFSPCGVSRLAALPPLVSSPRPRSYSVQRAMVRIPPRALVVAGVATVAALISQRVKPLPCPYSTRWLLAVPRPYLTPEALRRILEPRAGQRLLEVGPGTGYHSLPVAEWLQPGGTLDVLDVQQEMLDDLMRHARDRGIENITPRKGDARCLPYPDASFDSAYLVTVLGEIPDQNAALRELHRVLRPGGRLVVGEIPPLDPHFVRFAVLRRRAEAAGFRFHARQGPRLAFLATFQASK